MGVKADPAGNSVTILILFTNRSHKVLILFILYLNIFFHRTDNSSLFLSYGLQQDTLISIQMLFIVEVTRNFT